MRVLALDSTTRAGSVALLAIDTANGAAHVVAEQAGDAARSHAERLPGELIAVLDAQHLTAIDIDLFAVASGPGSFTGLRIGIATMQGLALSCQRPLVGVSAFEALAAASLTDSGALIATWIDAHRREVFTSLFTRQNGAGGVVAVEEPRVDDPVATLARWTDTGTTPSLFIGGGATMYADAIAMAVPSARILPAPLLASTIGRLAAGRAAAGDSPHPAALQPLYVRRPDAEVARDREKGALGR